MNSGRIEDDAELDPYYKWLGIPKNRRPPTYFDLLSLPPNENDKETIEIAAQRQAAIVHQFRGGEHEEWASRLAYEIEEAKICLLDPHMRQQYFDLLRKRKRSHRTVYGDWTPVYVPRQTVGEEHGITKTFAGVMSVILACILIALVVSFMLPWEKPPKAEEEIEIVEVESKESETPDNKGKSQLVKRLQSGETSQQKKEDEKIIYGEWDDLLAKTDLSSKVFKGEWSQIGTSIEADARNAGHAALQLPTDVTSYEFESEFELASYKQYPGVVFSLPIGKSHTQFSLWNPDWFQMKHVANNGSTGRGGYSAENKQLGFSSYLDGERINIDKNERCLLNIKVHEAESKYTVTVTLNGNKMFDWIGESSEIWEPNDDLNIWENRRRQGIAIACGYSSVVKFHSARIRPEVSTRKTTANKSSSEVNNNQSSVRSITKTEVSDKQVAKWVLLNKGGKIRIKMDSSEYEFSSFNSIPSKPFRIVSIDLRGKNVSDYELNSLQDASELESLSLMQTKITNNGLLRLKGFKKLKVLNVADTSVSDGGMQHLTELNNLEELYFGGCRFYGNGMANLTNLGKLKLLGMIDTRMSNEGMRHIAKMNSLSELRLHGTNISDEGVAQLSSLRNLRKLSLPKGKIRRNVVAALQKSVPNCEIISR